MEITTSMVKELREATGVGVLDCREALEAVGGDLEKAVAHLREKGLAEATRRGGGEATEGRIEAYIHHSSQVGVLLELNCETDFVARTDDFKDLAHDLALHIAFAAPSYVSREDVPAEVIKAERELYHTQAVRQDKPERVIDRIVEGRLGKFYEENCLMEQPFVKNEDKAVKDLIGEAISAFGEMIVLSRFSRYEIEA